MKTNELNGLVEAANRLKDAIENANLKAADKDYNVQDVKFARSMIAHHQDAVNMSSAQAGKGKNEEMVKLAKAIGRAQKGEIAQMKKWLKDRGLSESGGGMGM